MLPSPKAISAITAAVPMMMPSTDRNARVLVQPQAAQGQHKARRPLSQNSR